jgi:hypothetical protein
MMEDFLRALVPLLVTPGDAGGRLSKSTEM